MNTEAFEMALTEAEADAQHAIACATGIDDDSALADWGSAQTRIAFYRASLAHHTTANDRARDAAIVALESEMETARNEMLSVSRQMRAIEPMNVWDWTQPMLAQRAELAALYDAAEQRLQDATAQCDALVLLPEHMERR